MHESLLDTLRCPFCGTVLDVVENDRSVLAMKVVVGTKSNPTPVLVDEMTTIVFSPYWNIPDDIAAKEIEPKVERDPEYRGSDALGS